MPNNRFIDIIYDIAKHEFQYRKFTFSSLWSKLKNKAKINKAEENKIIGEVFTDMLQDHRFLYCSNNYWKLKEFIKLEDQKSNRKAFYGLNDTVVLDDDSISQAVTEQIKEDDEILHQKTSEIVGDFDDDTVPIPINNDIDDEENE